MHAYLLPGLSLFLMIVKSGLLDSSADDNTMLTKKEVARERGDGRIFTRTPSISVLDRKNYNRWPANAIVMGKTPEGPFRSFLHAVLLVTRAIRWRRRSMPSRRKHEGEGMLSIFVDGSVASYVEEVYIQWDIVEARKRDVHEGMTIFLIKSCWRCGADLLAPEEYKRYSLY
ncbi:hypothetical protein DFS33DRAFT_462109 [Desarmillaria ectypa]|nr:hypothetical protein DFS33DRAFT_462109 [Desarmillaria ectypa]